MTIHLSQGKTFDEPYNINDWEKLDKHLRYVSLTDATDLKKYKYGIIYIWII